MKSTIEDEKQLKSLIRTCIAAMNMHAMLSNPASAEVEFAEIANLAVRHADTLIERLTPEDEI